jgi:hypothetical protein
MAPRRRNMRKFLKTYVQFVNQLYTFIGIYIYMLYTGQLPVESVSWILLSAGAELVPRSGDGGEGSLNLGIT